MQLNVYQTILYPLKWRVSEGQTRRSPFIWDPAGTETGEPHWKVGHDDCSQEVLSLVLFSIVYLFLPLHLLLIKGTLERLVSGFKNKALAAQIWELEFRFPKFMQYLCSGNRHKGFLGKVGWLDLALGLRGKTLL